ncbi:hypothetical protein D3C79_1014910 [compost metagenome]
MPSQSNSKKATGRVPSTPASCSAFTPCPANTTDKAHSSAALMLKNSVSGSLAEPRKITQARPTSSTSAVAPPASTAWCPAGPACNHRVS